MPSVSTSFVLLLSCFSGSEETRTLVLNTSTSTFYTAYIHFLIPYVRGIPISRVRVEVPSDTPPLDLTYTIKKVTMLSTHTALTYLAGRLPTIDIWVLGFTTTLIKGIAPRRVTVCGKAYGYSKPFFTVV